VQREEPGITAISPFAIFSQQRAISFNKPFHSHRLWYPSGRSFAPSGKHSLCYRLRLIYEVGLGNQRTHFHNFHMTQRDPFDMSSIETSLNQRDSLQPEELHLPSLSISSAADDIVPAAMTTPRATASVIVNTMKRKRKAEHYPSRMSLPPGSWRKFSKKVVPFLAMPPEMHLNIFKFLHPIDAVCLSVVKSVHFLYLLICMLTTKQ
jgi:hypothetical protein